MNYIMNMAISFLLFHFSIIIGIILCMILMLGIISSALPYNHSLSS